MGNIKIFTNFLIFTTLLSSSLSFAMHEERGEENYLNGGKARRTAAPQAPYGKATETKGLQEVNPALEEEFFKKIFKKAENIYGPYEQITSRFPQHLFPTLPDSYRWSLQDNGKYVVERYNDATPHYVEFVVYGPDEFNRVNYLTLFDGQNHQSFAHTRPKTYQGDKPGYNFHQLLTTPTTGRATRSRVQFGIRFLDGHCIDTADTITNNPYNEGTSRRNDSNLDPKNHIPEPTDTKWGRNIRQAHVLRLRKAGGSYMQFPHYSENPILTDHDAVLCNNMRVFGPKYVPEGVYFVDIDAYYNLTNSYYISWKDPIHQWKKQSRDDHGRDHLQKRSLKTWGLVPYIYNPKYPNNSNYIFLQGLGQEKYRAFFQESLRDRGDLSYMELYSLKASASNEFQTPQHKISTVDYLLSRTIPKLDEAKLWEERAEFHVTFLRGCDTNYPIITEFNYKNMQFLFRITGFDPYETKFDFWKQIYSEQREEPHANVVIYPPQAPRALPNQRQVMAPYTPQVTPTPQQRPLLIHTPQEIYATPRKVERTPQARRIPQQRPILTELSGQAQIPYSETNYQTLISNLEARGFSPSKITKLAGYAGGKGPRDLAKMKEPGYRDKQYRWNQLVQSLGGDIFNYMN